MVLLVINITSITSFLKMINQEGMEADFFPLNC